MILPLEAHHDFHSSWRGHQGRQASRCPANLTGEMGVARVSEERKVASRCFENDAPKRPGLLEGPSTCVPSGVPRKASRCGDGSARRPRGCGRLGSLSVGRGRSGRFSSKVPVGAGRRLTGTLSFGNGPGHGLGMTSVLPGRWPVNSRCATAQATGWPVNSRCATAQATGWRVDCRRRNAGAARWRVDCRRHNAGAARWRVDCRCRDAGAAKWRVDARRLAAQATEWRGRVGCGRPQAAELALRDGGRLAADPVSDGGSGRTQGPPDPPFGARLALLAGASAQHASLQIRAQPFVQ